MIGFVKKRWYIILILVTVTGFFLYRRTVSQAENVKKTSYVIKRETLRNILSLSGEIDAEEHATLQFQIGGRLSWVGVKEGDMVKKYQGIASLDQRDVQKRLQKSLNTYIVTRDTFDQSVSDNKRWTDQPNNDLGDKMKRLIDQSQANLNNSVLDVELADLAKQYSYIYTPIEGVVTRVDAPYAGVNVGVTTQFEVVNPKTIYFSASADQTDIVQFKQGMTGELSFDSYPDEKVVGTIAYISFSPKQGETGTVYELRMSFPADNGMLKYRLGMTGDASFLLEEKDNVLAIPTSYVKSDTQGKYVEILKNGKQVKTYIKIGKELDGKYEILKGLQEGDTVYTGPTP